MVSRRAAMVTLATGLGATAGLVAASEFAHRRSAGRHNPPHGEVDVVVVLGCSGSKDGGPSVSQHRRVEAGVNAMRALGASTIIFTGSSVNTPEVEATTMSQIAVDLGVPVDQHVCDPDSTTTWENVHNVHAMVGPTDRVLLVSNPLHAARARRHWLGLYAEDAHRVFTVTQPAGLTDWHRSLAATVYETASAILHLTRDPKERHARA